MSLKEFIKQNAPLISINILTTLTIIGIHALCGYTYYYKLNLIGKLARLASAFISGSTFGLLFALLKQLLSNKTLKKIVDWIIYISIVFVSFIECFCVIKFHSLYNSALVMQVVTTNISETKDFLGVYMDFEGISILILFLLLGILCRYSESILWDCFSFFLSNKKKILVLFLAFTTIMVSGKIKPFKANETISAIRLYNSFHYINKTKARMRKLSEKINNDIVIKENNSTIPNIIFIIGESESKHFMSLYGFEKKTTPFCDSLEQKGNLVKMIDVISPQAVTGISTNLILTFLNNENIGDILQTNNFINAFKKCGYTTYWASNQNLLGVDVSYLSYCSNLCDFSKYTVRNFNLEHVHGLRKQDDSLLPILEEYLSNSKNNKNFYFFHLLGSHFEYKHRYPSNFQKFNSKDVENNNYTSEQKLVVSNYMNSILFTDYILNEIIKHFENKNAVLVYVSDHGEELWQSGFYGHATTNTSKWMLEIPMFFWFSDEFKNTYPEKVAKIRFANNKPFMTDDIIHVLLDLTDIKTNEYDATRSVINDAYIARDRIINGIKYENLRH